MTSFALALDIGGTHITAALIGLQGIWPDSSVRAPSTKPGLPSGFWRFGRKLR